MNVGYVDLVTDGMTILSTCALERRELSPSHLNSVMARELWDQFLPEAP